MKKLLSCLLALALASSLTVPMASAAGYTDIPAGSSLAGEVQKAVDYGLMNGYSAETFGYSDTMTRVQFVTVLDRMVGWSASYDVKIAMWTIPFKAMEISEDAISPVYLPGIEEAVRHDVVDRDSPFRPNDPITRGEMAEMMVRALGLKEVARQLDASSPSMPYSDTYSVLHGGTPFTDLPWGKTGYITVAYAIGMANGTSATTFSPNATATRAQAAAMLVRIYEKLHREPDFVHGFYAISSYSQLDLAENMDAVSAGWSRMTWDGETALLSTTSVNGNEYNIPSGYGEVTERLESSGVPLNLSVFMEGDSLTAMLASESGRKQAVEQIIQEVTVDYKTIGKNPYSGVTIDFEGLWGDQQADFVTFLTELDRELEQLGKTLYVCVSPVLAEGYDKSYSGYDYAAIGALADRVILMAYDYDTRDMSRFVGTEYYKTAATAPIHQVYLGLRIITEKMDASKVALGFSAKNTAWQIDENGKLLSGTPGHPSAETVARRLAQTGTEFGWSDTYQQPYAIYTTEDGSRYFLWYQDSRSVQTALNAARLLGVSGVSIWRLGNIPLYTIGGHDWSWGGLLHNS